MTGNFEKAFCGDGGVAKIVGGKNKMSCNHIDIHVARHKMKLKNSNSCLSFITTLWKGEVIMCCINNLNREIINAFCVQTLEPEDLQTLEWIIQDFIFGAADKHKSLA